MALLDQGHYGAQLSTAAINTGIVRQLPIDIGGILNAGTAGTQAVSNNVLSVVVSAGGTITFSFTVPYDYDSRTYSSGDLYSGDYCRLRVACRASATGHTLVLTSVTRARKDTATESSLTLSSAQTTSQSVSTRAAGLSVLDFDISNLSLQPGDVLTVVMTTAGAGTVSVIGLNAMYRGHIITTDNTDR